MKVEAYLPDGTILEFPEGTADAVVDRAVGNYLSQSRQSRPARETARANTRPASGFNSAPAPSASEISTSAAHRDIPVDEINAAGRRVDYNRRRRDLIATVERGRPEQTRALPAMGGVGVPGETDMDFAARRAAAARAQRELDATSADDPLGISHRLDSNEQRRFSALTMHMPSTDDPRRFPGLYRGNRRLDQREITDTIIAHINDPHVRDLPPDAAVAYLFGGQAQRAQIDRAQRGAFGDTAARDRGAIMRDTQQRAPLEGPFGNLTSPGDIDEVPALVDYSPEGRYIEQQRRVRREEARQRGDNIRALAARYDPQGRHRNLIENLARQFDEQRDPGTLFSNSLEGLGGQFVTGLSGVGESVGDLLGSDTISNMARTAATRGRQISAISNPGYAPDSLEYHLYNGINAVGQIGVTLVVGAATRNPAAVSAFLQSAQMYGDRYDQSRRDGRPVADSMLDATAYTVFEYIPERWSMGHIMARGGRFGSSFLGRVAKGSAVEAVQESATEMMQIAYDMDIIGEHMTWDQAWRRIKDSGIAGAIGGGTIAGAIHVGTGGHAGEQRREAIGEIAGTQFDPGQIDQAARDSFKPDQGGVPSNVTPEDIASPLPTDLISRGKARIDAAVNRTVRSQPSRPHSARPAPAEIGAATPFAAVREHIIANEAGPRVGGYDALAYNTSPTQNAAGVVPPRPITQMTIGEVYDFQRGPMRARTRGRRGTLPDGRVDPGSTGAGAYQFESGTLRQNAELTFGANWRNVPFSPQNQDRVAETLWNRVRGNPQLRANTWAAFGPNARSGGSVPDANVQMTATPEEQADTSWINAPIAQPESAAQPAPATETRLPEPETVDVAGQPATVQERFDLNGEPGVRLQLHDGTTVEDTIARLAARGIRISPVQIGAENVSTRYGQEHISRVSGLAAHEGSLPSSDGQSLSALRREGDSGASRLEEQLPRVSGGDRAAPDAEALRGSDRRNEGLRAGERSVGDTAGAGAESSQLRATSDLSGTNDDRRGMGEGSRDSRADPLQSAQFRDGSAEGASQEQIADETGSPLDARRRDLADEDVGEASGAGPFNARTEAEARLERGKSADNTSSQVKSGQFNPDDHLDALRQHVAKGGSLDLKAIGKKLGIKPKQAEAVAFLLSSTPNSGITRSKKGKFRREATVRGPVSAIRFLRSRGGIRDDGGHELMKGRNWHKAAPGLIQRNGMSVDDAGELLHEWGYFLGRDPEDRPTEAEVLDFIENAIRKPAYREDDIAEVQAREAKKEGKSARANAEYAVRDIAENLGLNLAPEELSDAVEYMAAGDSAEVALQRALNDASAQALYEGSNETLRDLYEAVGEKVYEGDIAESRGGDEGADATRVGPEGVASEPRQREAAGGKPAEDGGKEVETRAGVEATAKQDQPETSNATATGPQTDLLGEPIIKNVPEHETALKAARKAFPQRPLAQTHFVRGWMAERGDAEAKAALVGSDAEGDGAAAAKGTTVEKMAEPDMFGTREGDERRALEREAEGRKKSDAKQKAPGEDGGLFDTRDTTGDLEGELRDLQSRMSAPGVPDYAAQERFSKLTRERSDILAAFAPPSNLMGSFDRNRRLDELRLALGEKDFAAVESLVSDLEAGKIDRSKALAAMDQSIVDRVRDADEGYTQAYAISQARKSTKPEAAAAVATMEHERADAGRPPVPANWNPDAPGARAALTEQKPTAPDTPVEQAKAALQNALDLLNGKPSGEMIQDAGEKIGGARKDRWAERGMNTSDLEGMSQGEAFQLVNKDAVWPKPDYAKMVDSGVAPEAAAGIKILRDSLAAKPREDSDEGRRNYIEMMGAARDILAAVKTMGDLEGVQQRLWDAAGMPTERGMAAYSSDAAKAARKKLFSIAKGNRFGFSISYGERSKIAKMIREGFPAKAEPWTRQYTISPYYSTGEDVQGQRFIVRKKNGGRIGGPYDTREEAEAAAKAAYESTDRSRDAQPERPHLDRIERTGEDVRNGRDIDSTDFLTDFGFRGVEYGNWVASDERQKSTNLAYEALHDLASTLGIPPRALSLGGQLALAFGARGKGRAAAHYEPGKLVINLTKMSGAGSLAHEWGHAFDHYFGSLDTDLGTRGAPKGASGWMDYTPSRLVALGNLRPEMAAAFDNLMSTIFKRDRTRADQVLALEQAIEKTQAGIEQQKERVAKTKEQMASAPSDFSKREYQRFIKRSEEWIAERERHLAWQNERLAEANDETKPIHATQVDTDFAAKSAKLPGKQGGKPYWTQPTEMLARSFEAYVFDKIASAEKVSQYLVQGVEEAGDFAQAAYPTGAERQAINEAYDRLFSTMDVREQDGEQMLFQKAPPVDTPPFEAWFGDSKVVDENGAPLAVYHGTVRQFDAFSRLRWSDVGGIYFAPTRTDAENYTEMLDEDDNPRVISAYLSIQNPVTLHGTDSHVITTQQIEDWKSRGFDGAKGVDEDGKVFEWVAFEPSQIKSTDNRGTFDANDDRIMYQRRLTEGDDPIFYSALERAIESSPTTRASADQWAATLSKAAGVKKEELEWTGLFDWLDMQEGPVSRDDLLGVIRDGGIKVEEHVLEADFDVSDIRDDEVFEGMSDDEIRDYVGRDENSPVPQFGNWTSDPENTGYRELLITLPIAQGGNPERAPATHWDQEAVVAHARFMPKTDADGKRVLFVEEVQSDWHQKGRDDGYQRTLSEEELAARDAAEEEARVAYDTAREALFDDAIEQNQKHIDSLTYLKDAPEQKEATLRGYSEKLRNEALDENQRIALAERFASTKLAQDVNRTRLALIEARQAASRRAEGSIPNAPFKASWPALVMKRMIRWAVDNGYDRIAWTTGAEQAERYSLGEHVGNLDVMRDGDQYLIRLDRSRAMDIIAENGMAATHEATGRLAMTKEQLKEAFGADIARRVVEATETKNLAIISSGDLRVGGEGMKAFYDRNLVNIANDLIKKYGGKVEPVSVDDVNKGRAPDTPELIAARANLAEVRANRVGYAGRHMPDAAREEYERAEDEAVSELNRAVAASRVASGMDAHPGFTITPELADAARSGFPLFARQQAARGAPTDAQVAEIAERLGKEMARLGIEDRIALRVGNGILKHVGDGTAQGAYFRRMIQVATDAALNPEATLHHESIHAIRALGLFNDSEWSALVKQATGDASLMGEINRQYRDLSLDKRQEEAVAEFYSRWRTERSQAKGFAAKAFQRLLDFVHALGRAIGAVRDKPLGAGTVMRRIESGKVGRRETGAGQAEMAPQFQRIIKRHAFPDANVEARYLTEREFGPPTPRGMKPADYDLFARKLLLDDLFWKSVMGEQLSYGFTPESLSAARVKIERFLNDNQAVREAVRRYKFSELLAETAASVEPQSITQAQNAEPKEGQPPRAANIRIDKLESADDIKAALESVANDFDQFKDARRGVVSHEETQRLASDLDMTVDQLMARRKGQAFNAHEMFAAREMLVASADNLVTLAKKAEGGSDTDLVNFRKAWIRHVAIQEQVSGLTAEAGRALNQFKMMAKTGGDINARMLKEIINTEGGRDGMEDVAKAIVGFSDDPGKMNRFARDAYKPTWRDKLFELWINGLLSGPATHVVNAVSNTLTALTQIPEFAAAATIGKVRSKFRPDTDRILRSEVGARAFGLIHGAKEGAKLAAEALRTGEGSDLLSKLEARTQRAIPGKKGEIVRIPSRLLIASDELYKGIARRSDLAAQAAHMATKEGLSGDEFKARVAELMAEPTDEMIDKANDFARYSTFQRPLGPIGQSISRVINVIPGLRLIVPFIRTPANIFKFSLARTLAAPIMKEVRDEIRAGGAQRDLAIARIMIGTGLMGAVMQLASAGIITGGDPDDDDARRLLHATGWQPYSIKIGNTYYSYQRLDPLATLLGVAADLNGSHENMSDAERTTASTTLFHSMMNQLTNKTFLSGIGNLIEAVEDPERFGPSFVGRLAGSVIPAFVAQANNAYGDTTQRDARSILERVESRIPGVSNTLPARRDIWGREIVREGGLGPDIASPFWTSEDRHDTVTEELLRTGVNLNVPSRRVGGEELSADDYDRYSQVSGQRLRLATEHLVNGSAWRRATVERRMELFDQVKNRVRRETRRSLGLSRH